MSLPKASAAKEVTGAEKLADGVARRRNKAEESRRKEAPSFGQEEGKPESPDDDPGVVEGAEKSEERNLEKSKRASRAGGAGKGGAYGRDQGKAKPAPAHEGIGAPKKGRKLDRGKLADADAPLAEENEAESTDKKVKADTEKELSPARRKFLAMQVYYKALSKLEKDSISPESLNAVAGHLEESLRHNPSFSLARVKLEEVKKLLDKTGK